jgi:hypothetical protein
MGQDPIVAQVGKKASLRRTEKQKDRQIIEGQPPPARRSKASIQKIFEQKFNTTSPIQRVTGSGNTPHADEEYYPRQSSRVVAHNLLHTYNEGKTFSSDQKPKRTAKLSRVNPHQSSGRRRG